jgi:hypothetical protein
MILYHGSICEIRNPDVSFSKSNLDFGCAFYLTSYREQAEKWARRKAMRHQGQPTLNIYDFTDDWTPYRTLVFQNADSDWLDFVCACRNGDKIYLNYDLVHGKVADDDVFKTIDFYRRGIWDKERTVRELRFFAPNDQTAIISQKVIDEALRFVQSVPLEA